MEKSEFVFRCNVILIDVGIALENKKIKEALKNRDNKKVVELLNTEF